MKRQRVHIGRKIFRIAVVFFMIFCITTSVLTAGDETASNDNSQTGEKHLVISVVEDDVSNEGLLDLQDEAVPMALFDGAVGSSSGGTRHIVLMGLMLLAVIIYVIYRGRTEKKLVLLQEKAAEAEYRMMKSREKTNSPGNKEKTNIEDAER